MRLGSVKAFTMSITITAGRSPNPIFWPKPRCLKKSSSLWFVGIGTPFRSSRLVKDLRLAKLIDLFGPHALIIDVDIEPAHLEACQVGHQKCVSAHAKQRADVTSDQRMALRVAQVLAGERLGGIVLNGGPKSVVAQHFTAQKIDGEDRHESPAPNAIGVTVLHLRGDVVRPAIADGSQHGDPV